MRRPPRLLSLLLLLLLPDTVDGFIIQRVEGPNHSAITHASVAGGSHIYLLGTGLGSPFNPPAVFLGSAARCDVQPFTSTKNRLHCIVNPHRLPPISLEFDDTIDVTDVGNGGGETNEGVVMLPLRVFKGTRLAQCWHVDGETTPIHFSPLRHAGACRGLAPPRGQRHLSTRRRLTPSSRDVERAALRRRFSCLHVQATIPTVGSTLTPPARRAWTAC